MTVSIAEQFATNKTLLYAKLYHLIDKGCINNIEIFTEVFNETKIDVNDCNKFWTSLLNFAIYSKDEEIALFLIERGANVRFVDSKGLTALNYAVTRINYEKSNFSKHEPKEMVRVVMALIRNGANLVHKNPINGMFPSREAHLHNFLTIYRIITNKIRIIVRYPDKYPKQAVEVVEWMTDEKEFDTPVENSRHIIDACYQNNEELALTILKEDPGQIHLHDDLEQNALHYAVANKMLRLIPKLIQLGIDYEKKSIGNISPIEIIETIEKKDDAIQVLRVLDRHIAKREKYIEEQKMNQLKLQNKLLEEKEELKKVEERKKVLENKKNEVLNKKKVNEQRKKQKKIDLKIQYKELSLMELEDDLIHLKKFNQELISAYHSVKESLIYHNRKTNSFFFDTEEENSFWNE